MIIITSEYDYNAIKVDETRNIIKNTEEDCRRKYHANCFAKEVKCVVEFLDKIKNETKNITINCENTFGKVNKVMQSSNGMIKVVRIIELKILIEARTLSNLYHMLTCENSPILWQKYLIKTIPNRPKILFQNCRERHVCYLYGSKSKRILRED